MLSKFLTKRTFASTRKVLVDEKLASLGFKNTNVLRNLSVAQLYELGLGKALPANPDTKPTVLASNGAMCAFSGTRTGRSPKDKRVVLDEITKKDVWWGDVNIPIPPESFRTMEELAIDYINNRPRVYIVDGYLGWDPKHRITCRCVMTRAYHALFMRNMMMRPSPEELKKDFDGKNVEYYVINAGEFQAPATSKLPGVGTNKTCVSVDLNGGKAVILGSQYAGEMKKGLFGVCNYIFPKKGIASLHASCNEGEKGDTTLLFGLSGTGKTTLSADPKRKLIGDDEHAWSDEGVFNIEGGCYAKCINLSAEKEPDIYNAIRFGAIMENVGFYDDKTREVNYHDISITENTRVSYPLEHINNCKIPAVGGHPKNIIFLTCDAFGVLPPVAKLTPEQAMYHFITGYTAKVAGTEVGIKDPVPTFSACFGAAFLHLHPTVYAELLAQKMRKHHSNCWLINTGWSGGKYGVGKRMDISLTRKIIDAIHDGSLEKIQTTNYPTFNLNIPTECPGVNPEMLNPKNTWRDKGAYDDTVRKLAKSFVDNFKTYADKASREVINAGPQL